MAKPLARLLPLNRPPCVFAQPGAGLTCKIKPVAAAGMRSELPDEILKREGIPQCRPGRGVIENAPGGTIARRPGKFLGEPFDLVRTVFRIIHARSSVQPKVKKPVPSAWAGRRTRNGRIGRGTSDPKHPQQVAGARSEPVWVARLAHHDSAEAGERAKRGAESARLAEKRGHRGTL